MADPEHVATTRAAYDDTADVYVERIGTEISSSVEAPLDRALLHAFIELVSPARGLVADLGCGPGRVAALLAGHGLDVVGVDLSAAMIAVARRAHPAIRFEEGRLTALPVADGALAGAVCWYSIIHTPPEHVGAVGGELFRALADGGHLLLAFQAGSGERIHRSDVLGRPVSLTNFRHDPGHVTQCLADAGLHVTATAVREPDGVHESTPQAFIFARRPPSR
jgi:SAM-dependent methyltransferase